MKLRIPFAVTALALAGLGLAQSQAWEKLITPGLTYRMEIDLQLPRVIHALRYTPGVNVSSRPEIAGEVVIDMDTETKGREALSTTIERNGAIAGINADFFPWTGDPLGLMVRRGELLSSPFPDRSVFAWGAGYSFAGPATFRGSIVGSGMTLSLDGVNQECQEDMLILNMPVGGFATSKEDALYVVLEGAQTLTPKSSFKARVGLFTPDIKQLKVNKDQMVLVGHGVAKDKLAKLERGSEVTINIAMGGVDWDKAVNAVGGGPLLLSNGKESIDVAKEHFGAAFATDRHPRTAIGSTPQGDVWLVVVDGRQDMSRGATLAEMAAIMRRLGCTGAINLDGGGSSTLNVMGVTMNRPSGGAERAISNSLLLFGVDPVVGTDPGSFVIKGVPRVEMGKTASFSVVDVAGNTIPVRDVFWSAMGDAWIDQAGILRTLKPGKCQITAWVKGVKMTVEVTVEGASAPPPAQKS
ncbi:MAG: phosphodiester glycosidase family protein [Armatimonadetes bacterium]|nr:phosphodiester glycosidase family protein [Armatimonadota bacterium]